MAAARDVLPAAERARLSERLCGNVERDVLAPMRSRLGRALTVCVYGAFRSEADPIPLVERCWQAGDTVAAPRIVGGDLEWRVLRDPGCWRAGTWGVPEPDPARTEPLPAERPPDAVLVPGLAFHRDGSRLGYGGGYYDRLYAAERARGNGDICWIGFAFSLQVTVERFPVEEHDLDLDVLATDEGTVWF